MKQKKKQIHTTRQSNLFLKIDPAYPETAAPKSRKATIIAVQL